MREKTISWEGSLYPVDGGFLGNVGICRSEVPRDGSLLLYLCSCRLRTTGKTTLDACYLVVPYLPIKLDAHAPFHDTAKRSFTSKEVAPPPNLIHPFIVSFKINFLTD